MLSRVIYIASFFLYRAKYFLSRVREKIAAKKPSHSKKNFNNRVMDNSYMYMELKNKNKDTSQIDKLIVDLIMDHFNLLEMSSEPNVLTSQEFDNIVDRAAELLYAKLLSQGDPAQA